MFKCGILASWDDTFINIQHKMLFSIHVANIIY